MPEVVTAPRHSLVRDPRHLRAGVIRGPEGFMEGGSSIRTTIGPSTSTE